MLFNEFSERIRAETANKSCVVAVHLVLFFVSCNSNFVCIDDDYEITHFLVWCERSLVLSTKKRSSFNCNTSERLSGSINDVPVAFLIRESIIHFIKASDSSSDEVQKAYSSFGLAADYIALEEYDAALEKLSSIEETELPAQLKGCIFYNKGIIFLKKGDGKTAEECFKKAVLADSKNIDARINLELSSREVQKTESNSGERELQAVQEDHEESDLEKQIFRLIRKQESNQWRKIDSEKDDSDVLDY